MNEEKLIIEEELISVRDSILYRKVKLKEIEQELTQLQERKRTLTAKLTNSILGV